MNESKEMDAAPSSESERQELKEKILEINRKLLTLEWDKKHNQLNAGMEAAYMRLKAQHDELVKKLAETGN